MQAEPDKSPEQILWQGVVFRAVIDATGDDKGPREEADRWIRRGGPKYKRVVTLSGMDPDYLRDAYIAGRVRPDLLRAAMKY